MTSLRENITSKIEKTNAQGLIIEISGVDILDSYIARSIRDISQMAKLMGVQTVIAGLDPGMAITLVEMGLDLAGITTAFNLESALEMLSATQAQEKLDILKSSIVSIPRTNYEQFANQPQKHQPQCL